MPDQPPTSPERPAPWAPRPQSPSNSYSSLRQLREQIETERRSRTGETPIVASAADDGATAQRPAVPQRSAPLPQPGTPLFGPRGIVSHPIAAPPAPPASEPPAEVAPRVSRPRAMPPEPPAPEPTLDDGSPSFAHLFGDGHATPATPPVLARQILPAMPRPKPAPANKGRSGSFTHVSRIVTIVVGVIAIAVIVGRPLLGLAQAHQRGNTSFSGTALGQPQPGATDTTFTPAPLDTTHPPPVLWAESAYLLDETNGAVLYAKNPYEELPMASTTKLMTAVVALAHASPNQTITVTADAANTFCTCVGLRAGERYSLHDLLFGMLMISGNDAATAIAEGLTGNEQTFIKWMNDTAAALGLDHTHYVNPHGLDDNGHYSSARDLAVLGRYALSLPLIHQILQTRTYTIPATASHPRHDLVNQHQPLWWYPDADGGKPGWTGAAQFVDILSAERDGHHLIAVVMHSENDWVTDIRDLLNWGFDDFTWVSPHDVLQHTYIPFAAAYNNFDWDVPSRTLTDGTRTYFIYTGFSVSGAFLTYFNKNGGLGTFGYPEGMPAPNTAGQLAQRFDKSTIACVIATGQCQTVANGK